MQKDKVIYQLTVEDVQTVANDLLNRDLSQKEILEIEDEISKNIGWYDAIEDAIVSHFTTNS